MNFTDLKIKIKDLLKDLNLFLRIFFFTIRLPFSIRFKPLAEVLDQAASHKKINISDDEKELQENKINCYTNFLLGFHIPIFRNSCLKKSVILFKFLREIGIDVKINLGVVKNSSITNLKKGHAWLSINGKLYAPKDDFIDNYIFVYSFPNGSSRS